VDQSWLEKLSPKSNPEEDTPNVQTKPKQSTTSIFQTYKMNRYRRELSPFQFEVADGAKIAHDADGGMPFGVVGSSRLILAIEPFGMSLIIGIVLTSRSVRVVYSEPHLVGEVKRIQVPSPPLTS
jgi:hypothetical protein